MRSLLPALALALVLAPGLAAAECTCTCLGGRPMAVCRPQALVEPICQQICTPKIEQSLGQNPLAGGGGGGGGTISQSATSSGIAPSVLDNPATLNALGGR